jgi:hypothetical protein
MSESTPGSPATAAAVLIPVAFLFRPIAAKASLLCPIFGAIRCKMLRGTFAFSILDWASTVLAAPHTARIARQISVLLFRIERLSCNRKQVVCQKLRWSRRTVHIVRLMNGTVKRAMLSTCWKVRRRARAEKPSDYPSDGRKVKNNVAERRAPSGVWRKHSTAHRARTLAPRYYSDSWLCSRAAQQRIEP